MADSKIVLRSRDFINNLNKIDLAMHMEKMDALAGSLDSVRQRAAIRYMYPRKYSKSQIVVKRNKHNNPVAYVRGSGGYLTPLVKLQPSRSDKLTVRTGLLQDVLLMPGAWSKSKQQYSFRSNPNLMLWVRPQREGNVNYYMARFSITGRSGDDLEYRIKHETRGDRSGMKRPFIAPSMNDESSLITQKISGILSKIRTA